MNRLDTLPLGAQFGPRYRTVGEADVIDNLLYYGWAFEMRGAGGRAAAAAEAQEALDRLIRAGLAFESSGGKRRFAPAEVLNFAKRAGLYGIDPLWEERFVSTARRLVREIGHGAGTGLPVFDTLGDKRFSVQLQRDFDLRHARPGARIRLRLPLPLEEETQRDIAIDFVPPAGLETDAKIEPGRLDVGFTLPADPQISLAVRLSFTAHPTLEAASAEPLDPGSKALYTRPRESILVVTPRIRTLAAELTEGTRDPEAMVARFWNFMLDHLVFGVVQYDELSAAEPTDWALQTGWFDCQMGSALFAALCRACGIPARLLSGYLVYPTAPGYHYWTEAWLDGRGWVPFDFAAWNLSAGGRDKEWRDILVGRLDYRMKTQSMPRLFTGFPTLRFPAAWHILMRLEEDGASNGYVGVDSGILIYRDRLSVRVEDDPKTVAPRPA